MFANIAGRAHNDSDTPRLPEIAFRRPDSRCHPIDESGPRVVWTSRGFQRVTGDRREEVDGRSSRTLKALKPSATLSTASARSWRPARPCPTRARSAPRRVARRSISNGRSRPRTAGTARRATRRPCSARSPSASRSNASPSCKSRSKTTAARTSQSWPRSCVVASVL